MSNAAKGEGALTDGPCGGDEGNKAFRERSKERSTTTCHDAPRKMAGTMAGLKTRTIAAGFAAFRATGLHRLAARWTRGLGAILMFHRVRPWVARDFAPNRLLEITPDFFETTIRRVRAQGFDIVSLDEALARLDAGVSARPFAVLTFDDGYRDLEDHALPVMERHGAPFALYATTGYAEGTGRLWWEELEAAIERLDDIDLPLETGEILQLPAATPQEKAAAFDAIYWKLRPGPEENLLVAVAELARRAGGRWRGADPGGLPRLRRPAASGGPSALHDGGAFADPRHACQARRRDSRL
jgi:peptidoglycan/xylan/chitin deacetylase (PgdA/CDA1 family)